jgi:urease accessory protein
VSEFEEELNELRLLHLADSTLPIGGLAHSFGLETLAAQELLSVRELAAFLRGFLEEAGLVEAVFCRAGCGLAEGGLAAGFGEKWMQLNDALSARKSGRETRMASASLGKNFLTTIAGLGDFALLREASRVSKEAGSLIHHSVAFGLVGGVLEFSADSTVLAYLHQAVAAQVSACQRLLPLGQSAATKILWDAKLAMIETMERSRECTVDDAASFMPLLDWGAMEHPALATRLFIS